jgi:hypothetical protein
MYYLKKSFLLFFLICAIYIEYILFFEEFSKDISFMVLAMDNPIFMSLIHISTNFQYYQHAEEIVNKPSNLSQQIEEVNACPPKPTLLEKDLRISKSMEFDTEFPDPIRIKVPTITNTGSTLLIEGTGFIPLEQVRIELSIEWLSNSPEFKDKIFFQCKMVVTDSFGIFTTTLKVPETPKSTTGFGKYNIIGMESRQEKIAMGSFITSEIKFSARQ